MVYRQIYERNEKGRVVNVVPRKLQGQKREGLQAPNDFSLGTSQRATFTMLTLRPFPKNTILFNSQTSKLDSLPANIAPREYPGEYTPLAFYKHRQR